jgi:hypothetical protein
VAVRLADHPAGVQITDEICVRGEATSTYKTVSAETDAVRVCFSECVFFGLKNVLQRSEELHCLWVSMIDAEAARATSSRHQGVVILPWHGSNTMTQV